MERYEVKIIGIIPEVPGTKTFILERPEEFSWDEGAHMHVGLPGFEDGEGNKQLVHHLSIITLPMEGTIAFTTRIRGELSEFKAALNQLSVGDRVTIFKIGSRIKLRRENRPITFLTMGVGIASIRPLIWAWINDKEGVPSVTNLNIDSSGEFLYLQDLKKQESENLCNFWVLSRDEFYAKMDEICKDPSMIYYVIGSDAFLQTVVPKLQDCNVKKEDIMLDKKPEAFTQFYK